MAFGQEKISLKNSIKFDNHHVSKANKYSRTTLSIVIPNPHVYRHLYCTHEYMDWHEAKKGEDSRSFDEMIENIANDMNTSVEMVLQNYLVCQYSRFQLSDHESRMRAASKVNAVIRKTIVVTV